MGLHQLVYMSQITTDESVLNSIHSHAVRNNTALTVTGMLLFAQGRFLQVLEGERKDVHHTYEKIRDDSRHDHVTLLADKPIQERSFSHWNMGFKHLQESEAAKNPRFQSYLTQDLQLCQKDPDLALEILRFYA
ncbi:BLUF domain-containing protein [Undibacterium sp. LX40W]|uniref:BLUF domain-containing protein n=1 Tax=Undibacterium nitidum TaxID=2762298 RepID=A0A923KUI3_9BURK|nr:MULTISPECIES: BLUF domain-containing protein [Undibacterium]MBC3883321.1 BLUF domain-containing protein [Undibacterium nitidum]MBC3893603.1 BLUF domain-containing protein [Undibacterium sp. LX40W]